MQALRSCYRKRIAWLAPLHLNHGALGYNIHLQARVTSEQGGSTACSLHLESAPGGTAETQSPAPPALTSPFSLGCCKAWGRKGGENVCLEPPSWGGGHGLALL